jgi:membrane-bound serine protease (ClpP class)
MIVPIAIALLHHPLGAYACLVIAIAGIVHGGITRRFLSLFSGGSAAMLAALAFLTTPPNAAGLLLLAVGVVLMNVEFRLPTFGAAGLTGCAATFAGSLAMLAPSIADAAIVAFEAIAAASAGTLALVLAVYAAQRRVTLPR